MNSNAKDSQRQESAKDSQRQERLRRRRERERRARAAETAEQREVRLANMYQTHIICCMHSLLTTTLLEVSARPKHALHAPSLQCKSLT